MIIQDGCDVRVGNELSAWTALLGIGEPARTANLIAAAPSLLEACEAACEMARGGVRPNQPKETVPSRCLYCGRKIADAELCPGCGAT